MIDLRRFRPSLYVLLPMLLLSALGLDGIVVAQRDAPDGGRNYSSDGSSIAVGGIDVDVIGKSASVARMQGWRIAERKGWQLLARRYGRSGTLSDGALESTVSGIVIEHELAGGNRYIARLGVEFDRGRAGALLGIAAARARSAPMLVIPIMWSGGVGRAYEAKTPWQEAWARFRTGESAVDYVRPSGTGPDSLLMNTGQILRPGRGWWRAILAQYGAANVLIPIVHLSRQFPGGPVIGRFQARYGPDDRLLGSFSLSVPNDDALPALLDAGVKRLDAIYQRADNAGMFTSDPGLSYRPPELTPTDDGAQDDQIVEQSNVDQGAATIVVQFDTPNAGAVTAAEASVRDVPGVRSAATTSLALGAISVMRVSYDGDVNGLATALEARGWRVQRGSGAIRIERPTAPPPPAPDAKTG